MQASGLRREISGRRLGGCRRSMGASRAVPPYRPQVPLIAVPPVAPHMEGRCSFRISAQPGCIIARYRWVGNFFGRERAGVHRVARRRFPPPLASLTGAPAPAHMHHAMAGTIEPRARCLPASLLRPPAPQRWAWPSWAREGEVPPGPSPPPRPDSGPLSCPGREGRSSRSCQPPPRTGTPHHRCSSASAAPCSPARRSPSSCAASRPTIRHHAMSPRSAYSR